MSVHTIQILAAVVVVSAYAGVQLRRLDPPAAPCLLMNFGGTGALAIIAIAEAQWGFLLTNGFWR